LADNIDISAGTGTTVATDNIGGVNYQRVKVVWGADGTATDASAAAPIPTVQTGALPAGSAVIGQASIDQTTPGTTDSVTIKASVGIGSLTETAPATDTASSGLNGRLQRIAQRLTSLIALLPTALGANGGLKIEGVASGTTVPVTGTITAVTAITNALPAGTALLGKVGIDQTTPGTTNLVDTELPAAGALADGASNPTTPMIGANLMGWNGATWDRVRVQSVSYDMSAIAITTVATVATPTSGKQIRLMGGSFSVSAACSVLFENNAASGGVIFRTPQLIANTPYNFDLGNGVLVTTANHVLKGTASTGTVTITGTLRACEE
jgi:hypothetical protein